MQALRVKGQRFMSSQGSSVAPVMGDLYVSYLTWWGAWARSGDLGIGFNSLDLRKNGGLGCLYSDDIMEEVDACIAQMPVAHKEVLKKRFIHNDTRGIADRVEPAIDRFIHDYSEAKGWDAPV